MTRGSVAVASRARDLTDARGTTPLVRVRSIQPRPRVQTHHMAERLNPGGPVNHRPAHPMTEAGERSGALTRDKVILDATSGNTGIAYAMIGAARGYKV